MNKRILYKYITADTQVSTQECYLVGVMLINSGSSTGKMFIYDEADSNKTAARLIHNPICTSWPRTTSMIFLDGGIHCEGIYVDWDAGEGIVYYYY